MIIQIEVKDILFPTLEGIAAREGLPTEKYAGNIVEYADVDTLFHNPLHPYTKALLEAVPNIAIKKEKLTVIPGTIPNLIEPPSGCRFHPRCDFAGSACSVTVPTLVEMEPEHYVACIRAKEIDLKSLTRAE